MHLHLTKKLDLGLFAITSMSILLTDESKERTKAAIKAFQIFESNYLTGITVLYYYDPPCNITVEVQVVCQFIMKTAQCPLHVKIMEISLTVETVPK